MPHERRPPDDPREWIIRACSNLVRAQAILPGVYCPGMRASAQTHVAKILAKLGVSSRTDAPTTAIAAGIITALAGPTA